MTGSDIPIGSMVNVSLVDGSGHVWASAIATGQPNLGKFQYPMNIPSGLYTI